MITISGWQSFTESRPAKFDFPLFSFGQPSPFGEKEIQLTESRAPKGMKKPVKGWCSWYAFGSGIDEEKIISNANWLSENQARFPLEYVIIDDKWTAWGDWQVWDQDRFPRGIKSLSREIKNRGLKPGLWMAPFLVEPDSALAKRHPDWLVKGYNMRPFDAFSTYKYSVIYPGRKFILDLGNREALDYLYRSLEVIVKEWGIELLKLDFLYTFYINPAFSSSAEPDALLNLFLTRVRNDCPDTYIMASGCPFRPAVGLVDAMRFSWDNFFPQLDRLPLINSLVHRRRLESLEANLKSRQTTRIFWTLDPDVFACRPSLGLNGKQIEKLSLLVKKARGLIFLGDDLPNLSDELVERYFPRLFGK